MKIIKINAQERASIVSENANGLSAHFERLRTGSPPTQRSPLYKNLSQDKVFEKWLTILERYRNDHPRLVEYEHSRLSRTGPQGETPSLEELLKDNVELYFTRFEDVDPSILQNDEFIAQVRKTLFPNTPLGSLRPQSYETVLNHSRVKNALNTNSGLPDFSRRNREEVISKAIDDARSGMWKNYPAILGTRSSRGKARSIFMFPMSTNLVEQSFVNVLMEQIRNAQVPSFAAWEGFEQVEESFHEQKMFSAKTKVAMDYEGMDQTMGPSQSEFIYKVLSPLFQPKYRQLLHESLMHVNYIPIMISDDKIIEGTHGYASGSGWTNFGECIVSEGVQQWISKLIEIIARQLLGDDGAFGTNETDFDKIATVIEQVSKLFGLTAKAEKQSISSTTFTYLQRFFDEDLYTEKNSEKFHVGVYPSVYTLNTGMNPEKFHDPRKWDARKEILRWIVTLENSNRAPYFNPLIEFEAEGDKYDLGRKLPGFFKRQIVQDYKDSKTIANFIPSYNQASINRGINDFEVVKYLKGR